MVPSSNGRHVLYRFAVLLLLSACPAKEEPDAEDPRVEGTEAGDCSDGADNDGDRLYDCDDPDCAGAPVCNGEGGDATTDNGGGDAAEKGGCSHASTAPSWAWALALAGVAFGRRRRTG